jgi:hypothetical protein
MRALPLFPIVNLSIYLSVRPQPLRETQNVKFSPLLLLLLLLCAAVEPVTPRNANSLQVTEQRTRDQSKNMTPSQHSLCNPFT